MLEREKLQKENVSQAFAPIDDSLEYSVSCACEINERFTAVLAPNDEIAISATGIHMMFNMSKEKVDNIKEYVIRFLKRQLSFKEFWALKGVDLEVRRGEKVGLVGLNGSGKSTMLKIVSGVEYGAEVFAVGIRKNSDVKAQLDAFLKAKYQDGSLATLAQKYNVVLNAEALGA
jgi:ABC-type glutathione transport system ATPase component